jgi:hypothetical protein
VLEDEAAAPGAVQAAEQQSHVAAQGARGGDHRGGAAGRSVETFPHPSGTSFLSSRSAPDWTQRRPHLAGALPAAVTTLFLELGWLARTAGRCLRVAPACERRVEDRLEIRGPL